MLVANVLRVGHPRRKLSGPEYSNIILEAVTEQRSHSKKHVLLHVKNFYRKKETNVDEKVKTNNV